MPQKGQTVSVLHSVNPMDTQQDRREVEYNLDKPRIAPYKHHLEISSQYSILVQFKACSEKGISVLSNSIARNRSFQTHYQRFVSRSSFAWKTCQELFCKIDQSPGLPRVTLAQNSQHVQKDVLVSESRKSDDRENEVHKHRQTCGSHCVEFRIPGIPHSAVEQVETNRKEKVRRFIEQFENHPNRNMLLKDFEKSEEINHFSQDSKDLITEMGNNEIFEFYETSSKRPCPDCALHREMGNVYCTCGKCTRPTEKNRRYSKDRYDSLSILGYVIKKNQSRGPWHGPSMRQTMCHKARDMLRKAKFPKEWFVPNCSGKMVQR